MLPIIMACKNHCLCFFLIQNQTSTTFSKTSSPKERHKTKLLFFLYMTSIDLGGEGGAWNVSGKEAGSPPD